MRPAMSVDFSPFSWANDHWDSHVTLMSSTTTAPHTHTHTHVVECLNYQ